MSREPFETMPDVMDAKQLEEALQISKAGAYNLLNGDLSFGGQDSQPWSWALRRGCCGLSELFPDAQ